MVAPSTLSADTQRQFRLIEDSPENKALFDAFIATVKVGAPGIAENTRYAMAVSFMRRVPGVRPASPSPAPMAGETPEQFAERVSGLPYLAARREIEAALTAAQKRQDEAVKALEPFAAVAQHDIGDSEGDEDIFRPINDPRLAQAERLKVGDLRRARKALASLQGSRA